MKRLALLSLLLAVPALADPAPPGQQAWEMLYGREVQQHHDDLGAAIQLQGRVADLNKQVADLTKERDALKAAAVPAVNPMGGVVVAPTPAIGPTVSGGAPN